MHEAATKSEMLDITTILLGWKQELIDKPDAHGWTALHYAAHCGNVSGVRKLLEINYRLGHIKAGEKDDEKTALHMAAAAGNVEVMNEIMSACPDCWDMVDSKGYNVLHVAAEMEREEVINFILGMPSSSQLINQKSIEGNTPLHLLAASKLILNMPLTKSDGFWFTFNGKNIRPTDVAFSQAGYYPERQTVNGRNMVSNNHDNMEKWRGARTKRLEEKERAQGDEEKKKTQDQ
ncbi:ankyrin repeat domain-containing protein, partial [Salmonella enterica subsp. enterica serovar Paratyphi A]